MEVSSRGHRTTTTIVAFCRDSAPTVRLAAIIALGQDPDPLVTATLLDSLGDPDNDVRRAAALALGAMCNPVALEPLVLSLADEEAAVRRAAADRVLEKLRAAQDADTEIWKRDSGIRSL